MVVGSFTGIVKGVVEGDDDGQQPCGDGEDLVGDDGAPAVIVAFGEGVNWIGQRLVYRLQLQELSYGFDILLARRSIMAVDVESEVRMDLS